MLVIWTILVIFQCFLILYSLRERHGYGHGARDTGQTPRGGSVQALTELFVNEAQVVRRFLAKTPNKSIRSAVAGCGNRVRQDMKYLHPTGDPKQQMNQYLNERWAYSCGAFLAGTLLGLAASVGSSSLRAGDKTGSFPMAVKWIGSPVGLLGCILIAVLAGFYRDSRLREACKKKKRILVESYPEFVSKCALFLGAGENLSNMFRRVSMDGHLPVFLREELQLSVRQLGDGISELAVYADFGKRCRESCYLRLASLLTQNLRRGGSHIAQLLELESHGVFEEYKATVRRRGEEASTKMVLPMTLLLVVVLILIMTPAFMGM